MNYNYVAVYTDGSCNGNPGPGGYAAIIKKGKGFLLETYCQIGKYKTPGTLIFLGFIGVEAGI